jgi:hypothetical protein
MTIFYSDYFITGARILKHFQVTVEKIALGKVNFSNGILKQPDFTFTAVCYCGQSKDIRQKTVHR